MFQFIVFGKNKDGQLFLGNNNEVLTPTKVSTNDYFLQVCGSRSRTLFLGPDWRVYKISDSLTNLSPITFEGKGTKIRKIAGGYAHWLFLTDTGAVYSMGKSYYGQLCHGDRVNLIKVPQRIAFFQKQNEIVYDIVCGSDLSFFLCNSGNLYAGGRFACSEVDELIAMEPILLSTDVVEIWSGVNAEHFFYRTTKGEIFAGGSNKHGELAVGSYRQIKPSTTEKLTNLDKNWDIKQICCGNYYTIARLSLGLLSCGNFMFRGSGTKNTRDQNSFCAIAQFQDTVCTQLQCGAYHTVALTEEKKFYVWGYANHGGQLGLGNREPELSPVELKITDLDYSQEITLACGALTNYIYSKTSLLALDFLKFFQREELADYKIHGVKVHSQLVEKRLNIKKEILEKSLSKLDLNKEQISSFFSWVYSGISSNFQLIKHILQNLDRSDLLSLTIDQFFANLYEEENEKKDFAIKVKNEMVYAHRFVLQARSKLFLEMFLSIEQEIDFVSDFTEKSPKTVAFLVKFLYTDQIIMSDLDQTMRKELDGAVDYYQLNEFSPLNKLNSLNKFQYKKIEEQESCVCF
ncbi:claret [Anaeramoeba flamelloides]|uniref:Claret n=1 Tax=Anaeramoeba flamelloides TaxID=1746091 RepID=A0ABQ8YU33_9EUKA|nr:claret [Anaeramoeba flamelloides]